MRDYGLAFEVELLRCSGHLAGLCTIRFFDRQRSQPVDVYGCHRSIGLALRRRDRWCQCLAPEKRTANSAA